MHDGHKIPVPGSGDVNKEQVFEANATFFTPKPIEKETTKIYQDSEKETKISRDRKSTRLNSSHRNTSRMPSSA